mgnify:CR=1 FL=1
MVWHLTKSMLEKWTEKLLHVHDTPERTAAAFALGVTLGFSPFIGLHTVIGIVLAFAFNLNRVAVLVGMYLHLPWFMPAFYTAATAFGALLTGSRMPSDFVTQLKDALDVQGFMPRLQGIGRILRPLLPAYLIGSSILAAILGGISYYASLAFIRARRRHHSHTHPPTSGVR